MELDKDQKVLRKAMNWPDNQALIYVLGSLKGFSDSQWSIITLLS